VTTYYNDAKPATVPPVDRPKSKNSSNLIHLPSKNANVKVDKNTTAAFLRTVFALDEDDVLPERTCIGILTIHNNVVRRVPCTKVEDAAKVVASTGANANVYFETSTGPIEVRGGRITSNEAISTAHVRLDIDFQSPHRGDGKSYPADKADALELLKPLLELLPPSFIVNSGYGLQLYWTFKESVDLRDDRERMLYMKAAMTLHLFAKHLLAREGFDLDNVSDLARLMRVPGGFNIKDPASPRLVTSEDNGRRYASPNDILEELLELEINVPERGEADIKICDYESQVVQKSAKRKFKQIMDLENELQMENHPGAVTSAWNRERLHSDNSQSAHDWKFLCCLAASGLDFTAEELAAALVIYRNACADALEAKDSKQAKNIREKAARQDYITRTVGNVVAATGIFSQDDQENEEATDGAASNDAASSNFEQETVDLPTPEAKTAHIKSHLVRPHCKKPLQLTWKKLRIDARAL
jgi:hypothetical protein